MNTKDEKLLKGFLSFLNKYDYAECIDEELMALLVDNKLPKEEKNRLLRHISVCNNCYDKYILLKELKKDSKKLSKNAVIKIAVIFLVFSISIFYYFQNKSLRNENMNLPVSKTRIKKEKNKKVDLKVYKKRISSKKPSSVKKSPVKSEMNMKEENQVEGYSKDKEIPEAGIESQEKLDPEILKAVFGDKSLGIVSSKFINKGLKIKNPDILNIKVKSCKNRVYKVRFYVSSKGYVSKLECIRGDDCCNRIINILKRILFYPYKENNKAIDVNFYLRVEINKKIKILN